jgi:AmmeMemoRadiSam system protein B
LFPESNDPKGPRRIILPGEEHTPAPPPAEEPAGAPEAPHIVLPPGSSLAEEHDDIPDHPKLRPLEVLPVRSGDQDLILITDPQGVVRAPLALRIEVLDLLQLFDGTLSLNEISALVARESKDLRASRFVRDLISQLDRLLLLDSPRFHAAFDALRDEYHRLEIRQAALEGVSYPGDPREAEAFVAGHEEQARTMAATEGQAPVATATHEPRALLVPHLDPRRAGPSIARGYQELPATATEPLRVIVYGVGHALFDDLYALTRKHFETAFGRLDCDLKFVDGVAARLGPGVYRSELVHRDEHSVEFQALYLKHRFPERALRMVPLVCGGFHALQASGLKPHDVPELESLIAALREVEREQGGATVHVAAVDLSHVGTRFGDPSVDERTQRDVEASDRAALDAARRGDAEAWYESIASRQDATRVCGWAATYLMLRVAEPGEGRLLHYEQSRESDGSMVSIATMVWP